MEEVRRSDKTKFINHFKTGTKREFVGKPVDLIGEPQAWEARCFQLPTTCCLQN
jgi:hypothetical protein